MGKFADELRVLTVDVACRRLGEIADELDKRLDDCCYGRGAPLKKEDAPPPASEAK